MANRGLMKCALCASVFWGIEMTGTNAPIKPQFEGQIVSFMSPHANVLLFDIARLDKYGRLEWRAINEPTDEQKDNAVFIH